jgi:hypothetical protein
LYGFKGSYFFNAECADDTDTPGVYDNSLKDFHGDASNTSPGLCNVSAEMTRCVFPVPFPLTWNLFCEIRLPTEVQI